MGALREANERRSIHFLDFKRCHRCSALNIVAIMGQLPLLELNSSACRAALALRQYMACKHN
ncbi:hypothetical protein [Sphingomonas colocasiae]|uniref:Uncharacterized protein n=1 Tax=Sphingomonas colocasiae TaxID=1848973 RepID=A0ABS7PNE0_9SPHN|nr:hypothetical protein [Sphingomonas colocasiae]MBY8822786.1 hypothetical protein [Sphingomonas colocasiae]